MCLLFLHSTYQFITSPNCRTWLKISIFIPSPWLNTRLSMLRHTHALPSFANRQQDTDLYDLSIPSLKVKKKKKPAWKMEKIKSKFLKGRIEPGKIWASRCNLLMTFILTKFLLYEKRLFYALNTKEYEESDYFCNNFKINIHWNHTGQSELVTAPLSLLCCQLKQKD